MFFLKQENGGIVLKWNAELVPVDSITIEQYCPEVAMMASPNRDLPICERIAARPIRVRLDSLWECAEADAQICADSLAMADAARECRQGDLQMIEELNKFLRYCDPAFNSAA
jgi:hypothetical protein